LIRETAASLSFNLTISPLIKQGEVAIEIATALQEALQEETDFEVGFRILVTLGQLLYCQDSMVELLQALQLDDHVEGMIKNPSSFQSKVEAKDSFLKVAKEVRDLLRS